MLYLLACLALTTISVRGANNFAGFALSNSATGTTTYTCRTQDQVSEAFQFDSLYWSLGIQWNTIANDAKSSGFESIRLTGFDCDALDLASSAAVTHGLNILAGIFYSVTPFLQSSYLGRLMLVIGDRCCQPVIYLVNWKQYSIPWKWSLIDCNSDDVETFKSAYKKYGGSCYLGLTVGNEVNKFFVKFCILYSVPVTSR